MNRQSMFVVAALTFILGVVIAAGVGTVILWYRSATDIVTLPESELAHVTTSISVRLSAGNRVRIRDKETSTSELGSLLQEEVRLLGNVSSADCTLVLIAEQDIPTGTIQQVIRICQEAGFERLSLRVAPE